jgi:hypothetical protein
MALELGFDALMLIDDDQILPPDALERLIACDADIAYGLTVLRKQPNVWSAALTLGEPNTHVWLNHPDHAVYARRIFGQVIDCAGLGSFCTLIKRRVLEAAPFERRGVHAVDWYTACDAQRLGFTQRCDTGLLCGHVTDEGTAYPALNDQWYEIR